MPAFALPNGVMLNSVPVGALPPLAPARLAIEAELKAAVGGRLSRLDEDRLSYATDQWPLGELWRRAVGSIFCAAARWTFAASRRPRSSR